MSYYKPTVSSTNSILVTDAALSWGSEGLEAGEPSSSPCPSAHASDSLRPYAAAEGEHRDDPALPQ